ncbi:MAG TPA: response regulator transcription factor [Ktedonobacterales bacterium]|jgi:DNA-binding NarL/FixJ family response regulator|nr:response regulator transcription factor [Ktedonobacterales bacterium]
MSMPQSGEPIRVLIVDDQQLLRQSFRRLLELDNSGIEVAGAASDGQEALDVLARLEQEGRLPQVVLMDVRMPRMTGVEATARIAERWPMVRVLILTTFDDDEYIFEGFRAGAKGYLLKDISAEELVGAIRAVHRGEAPVQPSVAAKLVARLHRGPDVATSQASSAEPAQPQTFGTPGANELTDREREILGFLARGASNREIGESLFITEGTVKNHVSNILSKLNLRDRTQAALWAREHGLG